MPESSEQIQHLHAMRHSMAHILATAIQEFYPGAKFGVGPVVEHGFYYDVETQPALTADDLPRLEAKMAEVVAADHPFVRTEEALEAAVERFRVADQPYKVELLEDLRLHGTTVAKEIDREQLGVDPLDKVDTVTLYTDGPFTDLCRGPHVESTGKVGAFKLLRVSGAYWRGSEKNPQLQRVYGVGFTTDAELKQHLELLAEAEKRDHRKLGQELDLFTFSDLVGPGLPLYTPRGTAIIESLRLALSDSARRYGMQPVSIPHLAKLELYKISGHADKFEDELFKVTSHYGQEFILKPVNCPHHTQIYVSQPRSYRDLPLRYVEQTMQYRDEKPGQIGGLGRTRGFTVDDGHTFCRLDQVEAEVGVIVEMIREFYQGLGLWGDHWVSLSLRDPNTPEAYIGEPADWDRAERMLEQVAQKFELGAKRMEGEAALYGPKLDFMFTDALGRQTQLATIQLDFAMPQRFGLSYTNASGQAEVPVMIHRAILGSFERFIMLLIEHFAGAFPVWLAPEQVRLATVNDTENIVKWAQDAANRMRTAGLRVELDDSNESVGKKIRSAELAKVPYTIVVGDKEVESGHVAPRVRGDLAGKGEQEAQHSSLENFIHIVTEDVKSRSLKSSLSG